MSEKPQSHDQAPTVLIVDDDEDIRVLLAEALRENGLRVLEAEAGNEALALVRHQDVDAIVTDQRMPGLTGAELVQELRERNIDVPTILMTAASQVQALAARLGIDCFLAKPFGIDDLIRVVRRALDGECR